MKNFALFITTFILFTAAHAQKINQEYDTDSKPYLWGEITKEGMQGPNYASWFNKNFDDYTPNVDTIALLSKRLSEVKILAFMGTWCGDSKREVPRFYKILEAANYPIEQLTMIGVRRDREHYKQGPNNEEAGLNIHRVPTFILYKNEREIGRIIESPKTSIEGDLLKIINGNYTPNYPIVGYIDSLLQKKGVRAIQGNKAKKLVKKWKEKVNSRYHLSTYGIVLNAANSKEHALAVLTLNTKFFPEEASAFEVLGQIQEQMELKDKALDSFKTALQLAPDSKKAQEGISRLSE
jgi:thiol-disulfide isomerase/thioredoxin